MTTIRLPRIAGSRDLAETLIADAHIEPKSEVEVDARNLVINTESFAFRMAELLSDAHASLVILGGSPTWMDDIQKAAARFKVASSVKKLTSA